MVNFPEITALIFFSLDEILRMLFSEIVLKPNICLFFFSRIHYIYRFISFNVDVVSRSNLVLITVGVSGEKRAPNLASLTKPLLVESLGFRVVLMKFHDFSIKRIVKIFSQVSVWKEIIKAPFTLMSMDQCMDKRTFCN